MSEAEPLPVLVVGGGIAGLSLGIALLRLQRPVVVFDKVWPRAAVANSQADLKPLILHRWR